MHEGGTEGHVHERGARAGWIMRHSIAYMLDKLRFHQISLKGIHDYRDIFKKRGFFDGLYFCGNKVDH